MEKEWAKVLFNTVKRSKKKPQVVQMTIKEIEDALAYAKEKPNDNIVLIQDQTPIGGNLVITRQNNFFFDKDDNKIKNISDYGIW